MNFYRFMFFSLLLCLIFPLTVFADPFEDSNTAIQNEDYKKAYELLLPLLESKDPKALTRGISLIMKAATKGYEPARLLAFKLCINLANLGDTAAMYNVGYMCLKGWGGEYENDVCLKWIENAGKLGHEKSSKILARIYKEGMFGITPDEEKVNYWNNLAAAFTAGIDGKWEGSVPMGPGGQPMDMSYEFKTDGDKLTGTTIGFGGIKIPIEDGEVDGNNFSFKVKSSFGGMKTTTNYAGEFYGDTIKFTSTTETSRGRTLQSSKLIRNTDGGESPPISFTVKRIE